jgi:hypothetical protein
VVSLFARGITEPSLALGVAEETASVYCSNKDLENKLG